MVKQTREYCAICGCILDKSFGDGSAWCHNCNLDNNAIRNVYDRKVHYSSLPGEQDSRDLGWGDYLMMLVLAMFIIVIVGMLFVSVEETSMHTRKFHGTRSK